METPLAELTGRPGIFASAWRYSWLLVVTLVLGGVAGYMGAKLQPTMYAGVATVLLPDLSAGSDTAAGTDPNRSLLNQATIMSSTPVLQGAADRVGLSREVDLIRSRVSVRTSPVADAITVRALDPTAVGAAKLANAVVSSYMSQIDSESQDLATREVARLKASEETLKRRIETLRGQLANAPGDKDLQANLDATTAQLQSQITEELKASAQVNRPSDLVGLREDAEVPTVPAQPKPVRYGAVGALGGLALGLGLACWLDRRRHARKVADYRESLTELPALGAETTAELLAPAHLADLEGVGQRGSGPVNGPPTRAEVEARTNDVMGPNGAGEPRGDGGARSDPAGSAVSRANT